jgi:hypothetical protein
MQKRTIVALLVGVAIVAVAGRSAWTQWFTDQPSSAGTQTHRAGGTVSVSSSSLRQYGEPERPLPRSLATLQSPDPPTPKVLQTSADAADGAARAAADIAARN